MDNVNGVGQFSNRIDDRSIVNG